MVYKQNKTKWFNGSNSLKDGEYNDIIYVVNFKMMLNRIAGFNLDEEAAKGE